MGHDWACLLTGSILASINQAEVAAFQPLVGFGSANVTNKATLPQNRVETLTGSQAEFEITNEISVPFLSDTL